MVAGVLDAQGWAMRGMSDAGTERKTGMPVMVEITVVPVGTATPSVGAIIAEAVRVLADYPQIEHDLSAMGTTLVGEMSDVLAACGAMHNAVLAAGASRCYTTIKIDQRTDKESTTESKVASVQRYLAGE